MKTIKITIIILAGVVLAGCSTNRYTREQAMDMCMQRGEVLNWHNSGLWNSHYECRTTGNYCREDCGYTFKKITNKKGVNTNNQDEISKAIMECIKDCKSEFNQ